MGTVMKNVIQVLLLLTGCMIGGTAVVSGQTPQSATATLSGDPSITLSRAFGKIISIDSAAGRLLIQTEKGNQVAVNLVESTQYYRMPPDETSLTKAEKISLGQISVGDRAYARGKVSADQKSVLAQMVVVLTESDLEARRKARSEEWRTRGITGLVTQISANPQEITVQLLSGNPPQKIIIDAAQAQADYHQYAPGSANFSDSLPSSFAAVKVGDVVRALGQKNADGTRLIPEELFFGTFLTVGGTITEIKQATGEIVVKDIVTKQTVTLLVGQKTSLKRLSPEVTNLLLAKVKGSPPATPTTTQAQGNSPDMLESLPAISLKDLASGNMIIASSSIQADSPVRLAIVIAAGAEQFFTTLQKQGQPLRSIPNLASMSFGQ